MKELRHRLVGKWNLHIASAIIFGFLMYGLLLNYGNIQIGENLALNVAFIALIGMGAFFGPLHTMLVAVFGMTISTLISGQDVLINDVLAQAIYAFSIGSLPLYGADVQKGVFGVKQGLYFVLFVVLGNYLAYAIVSPIVFNFLYEGTLTLQAQDFLKTLPSSALIILLGLPLLISVAKTHRNK